MDPVVYLDHTGCCSPTRKNIHELVVFIRINWLTLGAPNRQDCSIRLQEYTLYDICTNLDYQWAILSSVLLSEPVQLFVDRGGHHISRIPSGLRSYLTYSHVDIAQEAPVYAAKSTQEEAVCQRSAHLRT